FVVPTKKKKKKRKQKKKEEKEANVLNKLVKQNNGIKARNEGINSSF
ncbi:hypothetical protein DOY81_007411, partial [Sarcophaga bullata]